MWPQIITVLKADGLIYILNHVMAYDAGTEEHLWMDVCVNTSGVYISTRGDQVDSVGEMLHAIAGGLEQQTSNLHCAQEQSLRVDQPHGSGLRQNSLYGLSHRSI